MRLFAFTLIACLVSAATASAQSPRGYPAPMTPPMVVVAQPPVMKADLGGGFIEFLFGDRPQRQAPPPPVQVYGAPPPAPVYAAPPPPPGYIGPVAAYPPPQPARLNTNGIDPRYERTEVDYRGKEPPGTIVIDTPDFYLYLVEPDGKAMRYGIGVGRPGFTWAGTHQVTAKKEWPEWVPPPEMLQRQPYLPRMMAGGPDNPLGARALYLGSTLYRIHGSNEPWTIGHQVSSGCIRLRNEDVIDLYNRVKVGATVVVL
jgi:lipoprotein-anchoring transpeptidase ErfK/SrfK